MGLYRLPAIVLRTHPFSDAHLIVTLLSPTHGKVRAIAKGSRRIQSALGRAVQPMVYSVFQLAQGKNLDCVTQGVVKAAFPALRSDLEKLTHGLYALELIDRLMEEPEPQPNVFFLLLKTLEGLESGRQASSLLRAFEAHLFRSLGYTPCLENCVYCQSKEVNSMIKFSSRLGGVLCPSCHEKDKQALLITPEVMQGLKACFAVVPGESPVLSQNVLQAIGGIFQKFLEDKWGKKMHGFQLLARLDHLSQKPSDFLTFSGLDSR